MCGLREGASLNAESVFKRHVDFGIGTRSGRDSALRATPLFQDRMAIFVPGGHALASNSTISLREPSAFDLILPSRDSSVWDTVEAIGHRDRVALQSRFEPPFMPTALAFVRAGLGIAILPESAAGRDASEYARIPLHHKPSTRQIELLQRRDSAPLPAAECIAQHLLRPYIRKSGSNNLHTAVTSKRLNIGHRKTRSTCLDQ